MHRRRRRQDLHSDGSLDGLAQLILENNAAPRSSARHRRVPARCRRGGPCRAGRASCRTARAARPPQHPLFRCELEDSDDDDEPSPILPISMPQAAPPPLELPAAASSSSCVEVSGQAEWPEEDDDEEEEEEEEAAAPVQAEWPVAAASSSSSSAPPPTSRARASSSAAAADDDAAEDEAVNEFAKLSIDELSVLLKVAGTADNGWFVASALACTCSTSTKACSCGARRMSQSSRLSAATAI